MMDIRNTSIYQITINVEDRWAVNRTEKIAIIEVLELEFYDRFKAIFSEDTTKKIIKKVDRYFEIEGLYNGTINKKRSILLTNNVKPNIL